MLLLYYFANNIMDKRVKNKINLLKILLIEIPYKSQNNIVNYFKRVVLRYIENIFCRPNISKDKKIKL